MLKSSTVAQLLHFPKPPVDPEGVTLSQATATIQVGATKQITATVTPAEASQVVTWTSDNEAVATVNETGLITAVAEGTANVKAETSNNKSGTVKVTVPAPSEP